MSEQQQQHLANLVGQRDQLLKEFESLQTQVSAKRELLLKVQGAIEYLTQVGVTLPQEEASEEEEKEIEE
jgi:hypothetical protein